MCQEKYYIAFDVSKSKLDYFTPESGAGVIANDGSAVAKLLRPLARKHGGALHVCLEHTGVYGRTLAEFCWENGITCSLLDPKKIHHFRKEQGEKAKTDSKDAELIQEYARQRKPEPSQPGSALARKLAELDKFRAMIVKSAAGLKTAIQQVSDKDIKSMYAAQIKILERRIAVVTKQMAQLIAGDERMSQLKERFMQVQGIGELTATSMIVYLGDALGQVGDRTVCALAGLAPFADESGRMKGPRRIRGGRIEPRRALYIAAWTAAKHNHILSRFYQRLVVENRKPKQLALIAVARKLLCLLNRIASDPDFKVITPSAA